MAAIHRCCAGALVLLLLGGPVLGEGPSRAQIAKAGKAATALVKGKFRGAQGSAFCIHPGGIFLTNEHVIRQEDTISIILNPGTIKVKVMPAKILRVDKALDLALVQVEGQKDLPALPLATGDKLTETDEVIAFGFPFGQALAANPKDYPAISVNVGKVTSLREKNGELHRIQIDAVLNPGNSGGPLLNKNGQVVGVVISGLTGTGVNFGIPVSHVARFISRPELFFDSPSLTLAGIHAEAPFQARALRLVPSSKALELELILHMENQASRTVKMELKDGVYRARAVPLPVPKGPALVRLTAVYPQGSVHGQAKDRVIKVGETEIKLSEIRRLVTVPRPRVWSHEGKMLRGALADVEALAVQLGTTSVQLDLAKATEVRLHPPAGLESLTGTVVARVRGKEVARLTRSLAVAGVPQAGEEELFLDLEVPALEKDKVVRKTTAPIADVAVGGGGRYLILHQPKVNKLAVFDVNQAKVVKMLPVRDDNAKFTAGLDKLVVLLPGSNTLQRWNLKTFALEMSVPSPIKGEIQGLSMGAASKGPIVVLFKETNNPWPVHGLISLDKLKRREVGWPKGAQAPVIFPNEAIHVRSSLDGKATGIWGTPNFPSGVHWIRWENQVARGTFEHASRGHVIPGPGGKVLCTGAGLYTSLNQFPNATKTYAGSDPAGRYLPSYHPAYYLYLGEAPTPQKPNPDRAFAIYKWGVREPLLRLSDIEVPNADEQKVKHDFTLDKRFHFVPQAKLLIVILPSNDQLVLHRVDVDKAREKKKEDKK